MDLNLLVTNRFLSESLKESGLEQKAFFAWVPNEEFPQFQALHMTVEMEKQGVDPKQHGLWSSKEITAAYTAEEIMNRIPGNFNGMRMVVQKGLMGNVYFATLLDLQNDSEVHQLQGESAAMAAGLMLLYLIKNGIYEIQ